MLSKGVIQTYKQSLHVRKLWLILIKSSLMGILSWQLLNNAEFGTYSHDRRP